MTDSTITAATVETATAITNATKFSVETDLIKSAFPILRSVAENKKNPRDMCNSLFGFTADNTLVFDIKKDSLTVKAADVRGKISLTVKNIPIKNLGAPVTVAFQNSKFDTFQKVLKTLSGEYSNFAIDGIYFRVFGEIADKVRWEKTEKLLDWFDVKGKRYLITKEEAKVHVLSKKEIAKFSFDGCYSIDTARQEFFQKFFPTDEGKKLFEIDAKILLEMIGKVEKFIPKDSDRYANVLFIVENGKIKIIAGNRCAIGIAENDLKAEDCKFILPSSCLAVLKTLALNRTSDALIEVIKNGDAVQFVHDGFTTIILTVPTLKKSPFENYQKFFQQEIKGKVKIPAQKFKSMIEKATLIEGADCVTFYAKDKKTLISESFSEYHGNFEDSFIAETTGEINFTLELNLLKKILPTFNTKANFEISTSESMIIISADNVNYVITLCKYKSDFAGMSFENKTLILNYQTQLKAIKETTATKIFAFGLRKQEEKSRFEEFETLKTQFNDSMTRLENDSDSTITSAEIAEFRENVETDFSQIAAQYYDRTKELEEESEQVRRDAEKQKAVISAKLRELLRKAA